MTTSVIAAQGPNDSLVFYWQPIGSLQWNPEQVAGPGTMLRGAVGRPGRELDGDRGSGPRRQPAVLLAAHRLAAVEPGAGGRAGHHRRRRRRSPRSGTRR